MTILDCEQLRYVHHPQLHRDRLHCASVHTLSVTVLGSDIQHVFLSTKSNYLLCVPPMDTGR